MQKVLAIVEQLMQLHIKGLKDLGVDLVAQAQEMQKEAKQEKKPAGKKRPIEDMLRK